MRNFILFSLIIFLMFSCVENKSVVDELKLKDVANLIEKDSLYELIILEIDSSRNKLMNNIVLKSKFKDLKYSKYLEYKKHISNPYFLNSIYDKSDSVYQVNLQMQLDIYKPEIDSTLEYYKRIYDNSNPENYFKVEFSSIEKEYYSYSDDVKKIFIKFKVMPIKGPIQGGAFSYKVLPKVTNKEVAGGSCRFSTYTLQDEIYTWEAPYDVEDEFENLTTNRILQYYNFDFSYLTVRINDETLSTIDLFTSIPITYQIYFDQDSLDEWDYKYIIESEYNIDIKPSYEIFDDILKNEKQNINKLAYDFESIIAGK